MEVQTQLVPNTPSLPLLQHARLHASQDHQSLERSAQLWKSTLPGCVGLDRKVSWNRCLQKLHSLLNWGGVGLHKHRVYICHIMSIYFYSATHLRRKAHYSVLTCAHYSLHLSHHATLQPEADPFQKFILPKETKHVTQLVDKMLLKQNGSWQSTVDDWPCVSLDVIIRIVHEIKHHHCEK